MARFAVWVSFTQGSRSDVRNFERHRILRLLFFLLLLPQPTLAQGIQPFSTQIASPDGVSIDMASGSMVLSVPIRSKTGKIPFVYTLVGNFPSTGTTGIVLSGQLANTGLTWGVGHSTITSVACGSGSTSKWSGFSFVDKSGAIHNFPSNLFVYVGNAACSGSINATTTDGTGYTLVGQGGATFTWTLYDKSGNYVNSTGSVAIEDPDGASIGESWGDNQNGPTVSYTDTLGETVLSGAFVRPTALSDTYTYTDAGGNEPDLHCWLHSV